jgi:tripartite-type tricarboxylate transporter receptor subunit TctC
MAAEKDPIADFYRGKTIKLYVGFSPGGGFDVVGRIVARNLSKHIPGHPQVVVINQPGAGTLITANSVYRVEQQDGTVMGMTTERTIIRQAVGDPAVEFDARKVQWLGSVSSSAVACVVRKDLGLKSIEDAINGPEVVMGGTGGTSSQAPRLLNRVLGTNFKVVDGYRGIASARLATESKEIDGFCLSWDGLQTLAPGWFKDPMFVSVLSIMGPPVRPTDALKNVPRVEDLVKGDLERKLLDVYAKPDYAAMPFHFGPRVPAERVQAMRQAFANLLADKEVLAQIEKVGRDPAPKTGEEVAEIYASALTLSPEVIDELTKIITPRASRTP